MEREQTLILTDTGEPNQKRLTAFMRREERPASCPDVTRCALELERITEDEYPSLVLEDAGKPNQKRLTVYMKKIGVGCDYKLRACMVSSLSPIAVGGSTVWERKLVGCVDPDEIFLDYVPLHLMNMRYIDGDGLVTSLIVMQTDESSRLWQVIVDRVGTDALILDFTPTYSTGFHVSAAMSYDLLTLYVVETYYYGNYSHATAHQYDYIGEEWVSSISMAIPKPSTIASKRFYHVDRNGHVRGYWAMDTTATTDSYADDGACSYPTNDPGEAWSSTTHTYNTIYGGYWDFSDQAYHHGQYRCQGVVCYNGDISVINETPENTSSKTVLYDFYDWESVTAGSFDITFYRSQEKNVNAGVEYTASVAGASYETKDSAEYITFSASYVSHQTLNTSTRVGHYETTKTFNAFEYYNGYTAINVTPGGWVTRSESATVNDTDMSSEFDEFDFDYTGGTWTTPSCPALYGDITSTDRTTWETVDDNDIIYPENLGSFFSVQKSFSAYDEESGNFYAGAYVVENSGDDPAWNIFRNGVDITSTVASCIGRSIDDFSAIYWRAGNG